MPYLVGAARSGGGGGLGESGLRLNWQGGHAAGQGLILVHVFQLNLSRFWHSTHPLDAQPPPPCLLKHSLYTPCPTKSAYVELTGGRV